MGQLYALGPTLAFTVEFLRARGLPLESVLAGTGLRPQDCFDPQTLVSPAQEQQVAGNAIRLTANDALGLEIGAAIRCHALGPFGTMLANAETLGHTGLLMRRFHPLINTSLQAEFLGEATPGRFVVRYRPVERLDQTYRFNVDRDLGGTQAVLRSIFAERAQGFIDQVDFGYPRPPDSMAAAYGAHFGCPVSFGHRETYVTFGLVRAGERNHARSEFAFNVCHRLCRRELDERHPQTWRQRVLRMLSSEHGLPRVDDMAARLNLSERSLRRRLAEEGLQYAQLVEEVRFERACYLLKHSRVPIKTIGDQLGYGETSNFSHAFSRWARTTPTRYREQHAPPSPRPR